MTRCSRQEVDVHHVEFVEVLDLVDARHGGYHGAPADVDEDALGSRDRLASTLTSCARLEACVASIDGAVFHALEPAFHPRAGIARNGLSLRALTRFMSSHSRRRSDAELAGRCAMRAA